MDKTVTIKLEGSTYCFYKEIADCMERPVEEILSDALYKCAEIIAKKIGEK